MIEPYFFRCHAFIDLSLGCWWNDFGGTDLGFGDVLARHHRHQRRNGGDPLGRRHQTVQGETGAAVDAGVVPVTRRQKHRSDVGRQTRQVGQGVVVRAQLDAGLPLWRHRSRQSFIFIRCSSSLASAWSDHHMAVVSVLSFLLLQTWTFGFVIEYFYGVMNVFPPILYHQTLVFTSIFKFAWFIKYVTEWLINSWWTNRNNNRNGWSNFTRLLVFLLPWWGRKIDGAKFWFLFPH